MENFDWSILTVPTPRAVVRGQLEYSWWELARRLETLTQDEFEWEPAPGALSVRRRSESTAPRTFGVGDWVVEWPEGPDHPGPRTVAWLVAHLTEVLTERHDWTFGAHEAKRPTLTYSGEVGPAVAELTRVADAWRAAIADLSDDDIFTVGLSQATEIDAQSPFAHLVAHINREIIHHGSEIFTLTDLYRVRGGHHV
ncbi:DinB family protein [uncultured Cellulomonas sp.]|uniref:DinB family protein n=1 Tax=uncultured Cellulomonas sp. TaxID=189682 RepID=UPI0028F0C6E7|nr:DinB family protein [uncultured Cellulomonas sp.]